MCVSMCADSATDAETKAVEKVVRFRWMYAVMDVEDVDAKIAYAQRIHLLQQRMGRCLRRPMHQ